MAPEEEYMRRIKETFFREVNDICADRSGRPLDPDDFEYLAAPPVVDNLTIISYIPTGERRRYHTPGVPVREFLSDWNKGIFRRPVSSP